jgi:hypothetical protein
MMTRRHVCGWLLTEWGSAYRRIWTLRNTMNRLTQKSWTQRPTCDWQDRKLDTMWTLE